MGDMPYFPNLKEGQEFELSVVDTPIKNLALTMNAYLDDCISDGEVVNIPNTNFKMQIISHEIREVLQMDGTSLFIVMARGKLVK